MTEKELKDWEDELIAREKALKVFEKSMKNNNANLLINIKKCVDARNQLLQIGDSYIEGLFETVWEDLKNNQPVKIDKVKQKFVKECSFKLYEIALIEKWNVDLSEIVKFVFHQHYHRAGKLPDDKRAQLQKDEEYKKELYKEAQKFFDLQRNYSFHRGSIVTEYSPEIYTCNHVCCAYIKALVIVRDYGKQNYGIEFLVVFELIYNAFWMAKNILTQLTNGIPPSEAIITFRTLMEYECKASILNKSDGRVSEVFEDFKKISCLEISDMHDDDQRLIRYKEHAKNFGHNINDKAFQNYGWILAIDKESRPNVKTLFKLSGNEDRYAVYKSASNFIHANRLNCPDKNIYNFLISEMFITIWNLKNEVSIFLSNFLIKLEDKDNFLDDLLKRYDAIYCDDLKLIKRS